MRAGRGDHAAYSALVEAHRDIAFRVAYLVTGAAADAEDATQDAFVKAFRQIRRFDPDRPFRPWLLRIVGNEARNRRRSEARRLNYEVAASHRSEAGPPSVHPEARVPTSGRQYLDRSGSSRLMILAFLHRLSSGVGCRTPRPSF